MQKRFLKRFFFLKKVPSTRFLKRLVLQSQVLLSLWCFWVEPPKSYAQFVSQGVNIKFELHDGSPWTEELGVQEMKDTLNFNQTTSFDTVH